MDCLEWKHIFNHCFELCSICWFEVIWIGFMNSGARRCKVLGRRPLCAMCLGQSTKSSTCHDSSLEWKWLEWLKWQRCCHRFETSEVISSIGSALDFVHSKGTRNSTVCAEPAKQTSWVIVIGFEFVEKQGGAWEPKSKTTANKFE